MGNGPSLVSSRWAALSVIGPKMTLDVVRHLAWRFEELQLPLAADIVDFKTLLRSKGPLVHELFASLDVKRSGKVSIPEMLVGFALLASGDMEERLRLVFDLMDWDADGFMPVDDLALLLGCAGRGASKLFGREELRVISGDLMALAEDAVKFAARTLRTNRTGPARDISRRLFVIWASNRVAEALPIAEETTTLPPAPSSDDSRRTDGHLLAINALFLLLTDPELLTHVAGSKALEARSLLRKQAGFSVRRQLAGIRARERYQIAMNEKKESTKKKVGITEPDDETPDKSRNRRASLDVAETLGGTEASVRAQLQESTSSKDNETRAQQTQSRVNIPKSSEPGLAAPKTEPEH